LSWEDRDHLSECVNAHFRDGGAPAGVVMDLADVEYINSAGLGALFQLCRLLRNRDAALAFANASDALVRLFRTIGLDRLAQVSDTVEQAVERLAGESEELELLPEPVSGPTSGAAQQAAFQPEREAVKPVKDAGEPATQDPPANAAKRKRRHS
jgi:anti-anti-sigma factor